MSRSRNKRGRDESSEEEFELGSKRLRTLPPENRLVVSKLNERYSQILDFYTFGSGSDDQLGTDDVKSTNLVFLKKISDLNCVSFVAGRNSNYVMEGNELSRYRNVYSWGGDDECLGRENEGRKGPMKIESLCEQPMVQIAAGVSHAVALTSTGEVISWGTYRNSKGEPIGFRSYMPPDEWQESPELIDELEEYKIIQVAASRSRSLALTETGEVFEWGVTRLDNYVTERHKRDSLEPSQVLIPSKIVAIYTESSSDTVFAEDVDGKIYSWGDNSFYQCGIDKEVKPSKKVKNKETAKRNAELKRKKIASHSRPASAKMINNILEESEEKVKYISSGRRHSVLLTESGSVYTWGNNEHGQLGQGSSAKECAIPTEIRIKGAKGKVIAVSSGTNHTLCLTDKGEVFGFGANYQGCLGENLDTPVQSAPEKIELNPSKGGKIVGISCGSKHNLIACERK